MKFDYKSLSKQTRRTLLIVVLLLILSCLFATTIWADGNLFFFRPNKTEKQPPESVPAYNDVYIPPAPSTSEIPIIEEIVEPTIEDEPIESEPTFYNIVVLDDLIGGKITVNRKSAQHGEPIRVNVFEYEGYILDHITLDNQPLEGHVFLMPNKNVTVSAVFQKRKTSSSDDDSPSTYKVIKEPVVNGTFTIDKEFATSGVVISINAFPNIGYELDKILIDNVALEQGVTTFSMPSRNATVQVLFKKKTLQVTTNKETVVNGSFTYTITSEATLPNVVYIGDTIHITPTPAIGYELDKVTATNAIVKDLTVRPTGSGDCDINISFKLKEWKVSKVPTQNGSYSITKDRLTIGESTTFTVSPDVGYEVDTITATNATISDNNTVTATGEGDISLSVTFKKKTWSVNQADCTNGKFSVDQNTAAIEEKIHLTITPDVGYELDKVYATNASIDGTVITANGKGNVSISVTFKKKVFSVFKNTVINGSFEVDLQTATIGDVLTVTTTPNTGYTIDKITASHATVSGNSVTALGTGDVEITVAFKKLVWNVTMKPSSNGSFSVGSTKASVGDIITVDATPNLGYKVDKIAATNATVLGNKVTSSGTGNIEISVSFNKKGFNVSKAVTTNGSFSVDTTKVSIGDVITVNTIPNLGYEVDKITATNANVLGNKVTSSGTGDIEISVSFKKKEFNVTKAVTTNGSFSVDTSKVSIGDVITVTTVPSLGYEVDRITATNATVLGDKVTSSGTGDIQISVDFKASPYTITSLPTSNGSFTVSKTTAYIGDTITVNTSPAMGYVVEYIKVNGSIISGNTFVMKATDTSVEVKFRLGNFSITKNNSSGGSFTVPSTATAGSLVTINATPNTGYSVTGYIVDGIQQSSNTFNMPAKNISVSVVFTPISWTVTKSATVNGSFTISKPNGIIGDVITVSPTPNAGYELDKISATHGNVSGNNVTLTGTGNCVITVTFKAAPTSYYTYTMDKATGGYKVALQPNFRKALQSDWGNKPYYGWYPGNPLPNPGSVYNGTPVTSMEGMFSSDLITAPLDLSLFDTSNVKSMKSMFSRCAAQSINISNFNTSRVTDMVAMFQEVTTPVLDLRVLDTSNVTDMAFMFEGCESTNINLSSFNTANVTNMYAMFRRYRGTSLNVSSFNTSQVTNMSEMFAESKVSSLDLRNFNTSRVTNMLMMFAYCQASTLDLTSFDTSNVSSMGSMFKWAQVKALDLSSFDTTRNPNMLSMFENCAATTGYAKTQADANRFNSSSLKPSSLRFVVKPARFMMTIGMSSFETTEVPKPDIPLVPGASSLDK